MKINHRIATRADNPFWLEIDYLGLDYRHGGKGLLGPGVSVLNVTEDQSEWPEVESLLAEYSLGGLDYTSNLFTKRELDAAEWLRIAATGSQGYPKPESDWFERTYDPRSCRRCGIHGEQGAPFRFSGEPKSKTHQFLQLHWVYDEFFVRAEAQDALTRAGITGIDFSPVLVSRQGKVSREASQMKVLSTLPPALDATGMQTVTCMPDNEENYVPLAAAASSEGNPWPYCRQVRYHLRHRGPLRFDRGSFEGAPDIVKTQEWFGSGGQASRLVVASQKFRQAVVVAKWQGLVFQPIELIG